MHTIPLLLVNSMKNRVVVVGIGCDGGGKEPYFFLLSAWSENKIHDGKDFFVYFLHKNLGDGFHQLFYPC